MEYNYEMIFFKYLYNKLVSRGDLLYFTDEQKNTFKDIFDDKLTSIINNKMDDAINFVISTYKDFYHLNDDVVYNYYGPINYKYMAPSNCIVIGLNYFKFQIDDDNYDEEFDKQERIVSKVLNYIQKDLSKEKGIKLATIAYNESTLLTPFVRI